MELTTNQRPPRDSDETGKSTKSPKSSSRLSSVANSIRLLKAFTDDEFELGVSSLAKAAGAKSVVNNITVEKPAVPVKAAAPAKH